MQRVVIAGATGYLGGYLVDVYRRKGWIVRALVRDETAARAKGLHATEFFEGEATKPSSLIGLMDDVDLVVSSLGITRQQDGLSYQDVDYQANRNLLELAIENGVPQFGYVHVINAHLLPEVELIRAKQDFVDLLNAYPIKSSVIAPSGYFSDLEDFLQMARKGRVYMFGAGDKRINPIHGADLAEACFEIIEAGTAFADVGGPKTYSHDDLARVAFESLGKPVKITHLPMWLSLMVQKLAETFTKPQTYGPLQFFLSALRYDMIGKSYGSRELPDHFAQVVARDL